MLNTLKGKATYLVPALLFVLWSVPGVSSAQTIRELIETKILVLVNPIILVVSGLALLFFFWGLAQFILNAGSEDGRKAGRQIMLWGIIALFIMFSVWGIVQLLQRSIFNEVLPPPAPFSAS